MYLKVRIALAIIALLADVTAAPFDVECVWLRLCHMMHILESQPEVAMQTRSAEALFVVVKCAVKIQVAVDTATAETKIYRVFLLFDPHLFWP